jgi:hypothetical protein
MTPNLRTAVCLLGAVLSLVAAVLAELSYEVRLTRRNRRRYLLRPPTTPQGPHEVMEKKNA